MSPRYDERAARALRDEPQAVPPAPPLLRARNVGALEQALRQRAAVRPRRQWLAFAAAAVAVGCVGAALGHFARARGLPHTVALQLKGAPLLVRGDRREPLGNGMSVAQGSRVLLPAGSGATLRFSTGSQVQLEEGSELELAESGTSQQLRLFAGSLLAKVQKLHEGQRFRVHTADAEIEVRGTAFRVTLLPQPSCPGGPRTQVEVTEGVVTVAQGGVLARVPAGSRWPGPCVPEPLSPPPPPPPPLAHHRPAAPAVVAAEPTAPSALAEQNDLFTAAVGARHRGDGPLAVSGLDRLLSRWPGCALAEAAAVERVKALGLYDRPGARDAARAYLAAYPAGFARTQLQQLLDGPQ